MNLPAGKDVGAVEEEPGEAEVEVETAKDPETVRARGTNRTTHCL